MNKILAIILGITALTGCASMNKQVDTFPQGKDYNKYEGMTPKQVKAQAGEPFSVGWRKDDNGKVYYLAYATGDGDKVSSLDVMMSKTIQCRFFFFRPEKNYKMGSGYEDSQYTACRELTNHQSQTWTADDSMIAETTTK